MIYNTLSLLSVSCFSRKPEFMQLSRLLVFVSWFLTVSICLSGCVSQGGRSLSSETVFQRVSDAFVNCSRAMTGQAAKGKAALQRPVSLPSLVTPEGAGQALQREFDVIEETLVALQARLHLQTSGSDLESIDLCWKRR